MDLVTDIVPDPLIKSNTWLEICQLRERRNQLIKNREAIKKQRLLDFQSCLGHVPEDLLAIYSKPCEVKEIPTRPLTLEQELELMRVLLAPSTRLPQTSQALTDHLLEIFDLIEEADVRCTLDKLQCQNLLTLEDDNRQVVFVDLLQMEKIFKYRDEKQYLKIKSLDQISSECRKRKLKEVLPDIPPKFPRFWYREYWRKLASELLKERSFLERQEADRLAEIHDLLTTPTARDRMNAEMFRSEETRIIQFCNHLTRVECRRRKSRTGDRSTCRKLHYRPVKSNYTEKKLGDCSFLNTCFHMQSCKYMHYELDLSKEEMEKFLEKDSSNVERGVPDKSIILYPPQWIQCDIRTFDMPCLGKFSVIMADPPWDIHMELPYGTMSDKEMVGLPIPDLSDEGFIFLWVTGRAMEVGRECLKQWGYRRCEDLIWVKINQLGKLIRTGRTGHWINHGKEHCLVGIKGNPKGHTACVDTDVLISEVRETSHKPDEIYGLVERLSPGTRKLELFGRMHNTRPNWLTLGNQVDGVRLLDPDIARGFKKVYPDGNAMLHRARRPPANR